MASLGGKRNIYWTWRYKRYGRGGIGRGVLRREPLDGGPSLWSLPLFRQGRSRTIPPVGTAPQHLYSPSALIPPQGFDHGADAPLSTVRGELTTARCGQGEPMLRRLQLSWPPRPACSRTTRSFVLGIRPVPLTSTIRSTHVRTTRNPKTKTRSVCDKGRRRSAGVLR